MLDMFGLFTLTVIEGLFWGIPRHSRRMLAYLPDSITMLGEALSGKQIART